MWTKLRNWLLYRAIRRVQREGYAVLPEVRARAAHRLALDLREYVRKSGHLHTVSGRTPRAVRRIERDTHRLHLATCFLPTLEHLPEQLLLVDERAEDDRLAFPDEVRGEPDDDPPLTVGEAVRRARGGDPPTEIQGYA